MLKISKLSAMALAIIATSAAHAATVNAAVTGWNLLGYSDAADVVVADAFGDKALVTTVWKWTGAGWAFYSPDLLDGGQSYAQSKGYAFLTTIKSGDGFWVNAKQPFSATLPAPAASVNAEAFTGISTTLQTFVGLFATAVPTTTTELAPLVDDSFLMGGADKAMFLQGMLNGNGPRPGESLGTIQLTNPLDAGGIQNDPTHQWFTFLVGNGGGPDSAWLAIKNSAGKWLMAGDQRQFNFYTSAQAVKHLSSGQGSGVSYNNQINASVENVPNTVTQIVLTGPGVIPASGLTIYSAGVGAIWPQSCFGSSNTTMTNCIDAAAASASSRYTIKAYGSTSTTTPLYTYTNVLPRAPLDPSSLASLSYPTISNVTGNWVSGSSVSVTWTAAANTWGDWLDIGAWTNSGQSLFSNVGTDIAGSTGATTTLTVPNYSGTIGGKMVWISVRDASGNRLALDAPQ